MSKRGRRNHSQRFEASVALAAMKPDLLTELCNVVDTVSLEACEDHATREHCRRNHAPLAPNCRRARYAGTAPEIAMPLSLPCRIEDLSTEGILLTAWKPEFLGQATPLERLLQRLNEQGLALESSRRDCQHRYGSECRSFGRAGSGSRTMR